MKFCHTVAVPSVAFCLALACSSGPLAKTAGDVTSCIATVAGTLAGAEDPVQIIAACGATLDDLIAWLVSNIAPAQPGQALSPVQARYGRILQKARALK